MVCKSTLSIYVLIFIILQKLILISVTKNLEKNAKMNAKWYIFNAPMIVVIIVACLSALEFSVIAIIVARAVINAPMVVKIAQILFAFAV